MAEPMGDRPLTTAEFGRLTRLVREASGISLSDGKRPLVISRLARRLRALGLTRYGDYVTLVETDREERVQMLDALCTHETSFFREPSHFQFLEEEVFPSWSRDAARGARERSVRIWSAACSSGEEPFSIAMSLLDAFEGWQLEVLATDLSTRVLARAQEATWPVDRAGQIPRRRLVRYMLEGHGGSEGLMRASEPLRRQVRFERVNLIGEELPRGLFDAVFCRNVLIYFDAATKAQVVQRLVERLRPGGYLFLGHAESLLRPPPGLEAAIPTVYRRTP